MIEPRFSRTGFGDQEVPFYGLTFDKAGMPTSPETQDALPGIISDASFTDILIVSHGWNTEWEHAVNLYTRLMDGVGAMATDYSEVLPTEIRPLVIGLSWPSAAFVWPGDRAPKIAGGGTDDDAEEEPDDLGIIKDILPPESATAVEELVSGKEQMSGAEVQQLARLLAPAIGATASEDQEPDVDAEDLAAMLTAELTRARPGDDGGDGFDLDQAGTLGSGANEPQAAGVFSDLFGVRTVLRLATVRIMKDRAGIVGRAGVAQLVGHLLANTSARLHLVGHSYGTKLLLSAVVRANTARPVTSALLLQPAINHLAFAKDIGDGREGGLRLALSKIEKPVLTTESRDDFPLRRVFHLAVRRKKDLGEEPDTLSASSRFRAMGGYGPSQLGQGELLETSLPAPGGAFPSGAGAEVINLDASDLIKGHSRIVTDRVFWAIVHNMR